MSNWPPISKLADEVRTGKTTATEQVAKSLKLIDEGKDYKAIIATTKDRATKRASEVDERIAKGENPGRLAGVPFIAKDNFLVFGADTTAASNILKGFDAPYQSTAIERLEAEGAICVAKANLDAFGHGASTENSDFMVTLNPHDKKRVAGGSSGGSAAAVVLGMAPFALGTDTGGSTRQPASFTGAIGFKPTYGLISRSGVVAMASSTDTVGTIAQSMDDLELVVDVLAGKDALDATTIDRDERGYQVKPAKLNGCKIGVIKEWMGEGLSSETRDGIDSAIKAIKQAGASVEEVSIPSLPLSLAVYYIVVPAEISSNLSRYDGQRYGYSSHDAKSLEESYVQSRSQGFGDEAKRRIMIGTYVLSSGYYDAYYQKAQLVRTKLISEFRTALDEFDILIGPVAPTPAFKVGENTDDPLHMYLADVMTVGPSLAGVPAISIPCSTNGLPVGLQIIANQREDRQLLEYAHALEGII